MSVAKPSWTEDPVSTPERSEEPHATPDHGRLRSLEVSCFIDSACSVAYEYACECIGWHYLGDDSCPGPTYGNNQEQLWTTVSQRGS